VNALRIDHVDGLFNPAEYCRLVQAGAGKALGRPADGTDAQPLYLLVEKILAPHEPLRGDWPVAGTTGYDFMNQATGLFVAADGERALTSTYHAFIGAEMDFDREVYDAKKRIVDEHMASEMRVLAVRLGRLAASHWRSRDFTLSVLYTALKEVVACLPVYRTYVTSRRVTDIDRKYLEWAVTKARRLNGADGSVYDFLHAVLDTSLGREPGHHYARRAVVDFAMRVQQYTGPVMAKGCEDTALYRANRLIALNEVGGDPRRFGVTVAAFHQACRARERSHPHAMLATATHDSKRGEDVRVRIAVLSEFPEEWRQHVERWQQLNFPFRKVLDSGPAPEPNDEMFLYQTMVGAWPGDAGAVEGTAFIERLAEVAVKSAKEAKRRTSWAFPDLEYEAVVADFVRRICETGRRNPFLDDFIAFQRHLVRIGMVNGLSQELLKLTCPGVPDLYQGSELWHLDMVDPDNRRPVDYARRRALLGTQGGRPLPADPDLWSDGSVKQEVIRRTLGLRRRLPDLFERGAYRPLPVRGARNAHCLAFARLDQDHAVIVAVPLLLARLWPDGGTLPPLGGAWRELHIEAPRRGGAGLGGDGRWHDIFSGRDVPVVVRRGTPVLFGPDLFASFPVALLEWMIA
jgi:(1->4)-alpha-D-glucan 1-alpha-D-glucosylmutase